MQTSHYREASFRFAWSSTFCARVTQLYRNRKSFTCSFEFLFAQPDIFLFGVVTIQVWVPRWADNWAYPCSPTDQCSAFNSACSSSLSHADLCVSSGAVDGHDIISCLDPFLPAGRWRYALIHSCGRDKIIRGF